MFVVCLEFFFVCSFWSISTGDARMHHSLSREEREDAQGETQGHSVLFTTYAQQQASWNTEQDINLLKICWIQGFTGWSTSNFLSIFYSEDWPSKLTVNKITETLGKENLVVKWMNQLDSIMKFPCCIVEIVHDIMYVICYSIVTHV